jgi:hypothetical protein
MSPLDHPTFQAAVQRETEVREAPFLGLPFYIEGLSLPPLTLRSFLRLRLAGNPYICGGDKFPGDAAAFLYEVTGQTGNREGYAESISKLNWEKVNAGIVEYKGESFFDRTGVTDDEGTTRSYWSDPAALCDSFGREYGWTIEHTMNAPIAAILQLSRVIGKRLDPETPLFNPLSDRALMEAASS